MKKLFFIPIGICLATCVNAQQLTTIKLNAPNKKRGKTTMETFDNRKSIREYGENTLTTQDLSDLLWAANGLNRTDPDKRTAPTAMDKQEIDLYVCMKDGAYLYDAKAHELKLVTKEDVRPHIAVQQDFVLTAPVCLVIVADLERAGGNTEATRMFSAYDAGIVSQNISLFCAGCGFATVPRGFMDKEKLGAALKLNANQLIHLNHPVGCLK